MKREAIIEWYDGIVTRETVIKETEQFLIFEISRNGSFYAPKSFEKINKK